MDFLNVTQVLNYIDLKKNMSVAEFGCGSADFTIALAKKLPMGRVYALDIQEEKLSALEGKLAVQGIDNVSMILCDLEAPKGSTIKDDSLDVVFIPNVLFQAENKHGMIEEAKRVIKSGGQLLIIDWLAGAPFGPKDGLVTPDEIKGIAKKLGLSLKKEFAAGDYHYGLLFVK